MDGATLGTLLVGVGAVAGALVTWLGKRSETAIAGYSSLTDNLQEERDGLKAERDTVKAERDALTNQVAARDARIVELVAYRAADQAEIARLRGIIVRLGGQP